MSTELDVLAHYRHGSLEQALLAALTASGKDPEALTPADLMGADEFHIGGAQATKHLSAQLTLTPSMHILDIGSGLGGPARHLAMAHGCRVTGVDLSAEYVDVATSLTRRMGLADRVSFHHASATTLPFDDATFDGATLLHVGMNIADKHALFVRIHRLLRPGGFFAIYDVMRAGPGAIDFPVPWSTTPETSFVEPVETYRAALAGAGFVIKKEQNRAGFAREFFAALRVRHARPNAPSLGLQIVMGAATPRKIENMACMVDRGVIAPIEIIATR